MPCSIGWRGGGDPATAIDRPARKAVPHVAVAAGGRGLVIAVDTNILVNAHRTGLHAHERALLWLRRLAEGNRLWGLPVFCLGEFIRVVTHPRILDPPSRLDEAWEALSALLEAPTLRVLSPGPRYPELFAEALRAGDARGNLAFDAQIVAVCLEQGASRLLTLDADFARFGSLDIVRPDDEPPG